MKNHKMNIEFSLNIMKFDVCQITTLVIIIQLWTGSKFIAEDNKANQDGELDEREEKDR